MHGRRLAAIVAAVLFCAAGCGGSGVQPRPIETLIYVNGAVQGTQFMLPSDMDATACGSEGTGIQAPHADHQFFDEDGNPRAFEVPHLFVLENTRQPIRAVIRNMDPVNSIQVNLFLGVTPQVLANQGIIGPNECVTILSSGTPETFPTPGPTAGPESRIEVCSPQTCPNADATPNTECCTADLSRSCLAPPPTPTPGVILSDRGVAYFASLGDIKATNITNCLLSPILDACKSPSTFLLQQPQDEVAAVMSVNSGQNPGGCVPLAQVRVELYINGQIESSATGTDPAVTFNF